MRMTLGKSLHDVLMTSIAMSREQADAADLVKLSAAHLQLTESNWMYMSLHMCSELIAISRQWQQML
jgi:hypothetical protein